MSKKIRRILSSIAFFVLIYAVYKFYLYTTGRMPQPEEVPIIVATGILLIVLIGVISAIRYFYEAEEKESTISYRELDAELKSYEIIANEKKSSSLNSVEQKSDHELK